MKAIEINSKTDKTGHLRIDYQLGKSDKDVKVLIMIQDETFENEEEKLWMQSVSNNPAFDFLKKSEEDIYTLADGQAFND